MKTYEETLKIYNNYVGLAEHYGRKYNKKEPEAGEQAARVGLWKYVMQPSVPHENIPTRYIKNAVMREAIKDKAIVTSDIEVMEYIKASKYVHYFCNVDDDTEDRIRDYDKYNGKRKAVNRIVKTIYRTLAVRGGLFEESQSCMYEERDTESFLRESLPSEMPKMLKDTVSDRLRGLSYREIAKKRGCSHQAVDTTLRRQIKKWLEGGGRPAAEFKEIFCLNN